VLSALGVALPVQEIDALSGHAFRLALTSTPEGTVAASGPNTFSTESALALYEGLGWRFSAFEASPADPAFSKRRDDAVKRIRSAIDKGRPVIAFGLHVPEYGIIRGYQGNDLIASTRMSPQYGERIPIAQWPAPGQDLSVRLFIPERAVKTDPIARLARVVAFAVDYAVHGDTPSRVVGEAEAVTGLRAFERWVELLEGDPPLSPHGQAYCIQALQAARSDAVAFCRSQAQASRMSDALSRAAEGYRGGLVALSELATLFPYPNGGNVVSAGIRRTGASSLRRVLAAEREAVAALADARLTLRK
jgi:hypothetical protein